jgi:uncharacterized protein (DUF2236 family)
MRIPLPPRRSAVAPHADYGFFGPDSMAWKVWGHPTSLTVGFQRAVVVEELDPALVASVNKTRDIYNRPATRYDRTIRYFATVAFGGSEAVLKTADILVKVHSKAIGHEPYSGARYDANDPDSQLWILVTGWHSVLKAYEMYGPGRLSPEDEERYWADCAVAAEMQTCDPADVPRSRAELHAYYERMRPQLAGSEIAREAMDHLLNADAIMSDWPRVLRPASWTVSKVLRTATVATMPRWMREMGGLRQPRAVDLAVWPVMRAVFLVLCLSKRLQLVVLGQISPMTVPVVAPILLGVPPVSAEVQTPAEARERFGYDRPAEAHLEWRAKQHARVFQEGVAPSDAGLVESQDLLGRLA